ncbi:MAG: sulfite exporter TauE/SafE family protein [Patescibacteria group bacterium]
MSTYTFHLNGMRCKSCAALSETLIGELPEVSHIRASLDTKTITVTGDFGDKQPQHIAEDLTAVMQPHGYTVSLVQEAHQARWGDFALALPFAGIFVGVFILLQSMGVVNWVNASEVGYGTAFLIGAIASISTCMAVVGGLVLSLSTHFAQEGEKMRPQLLFHVGRLISFFVLGGVIGMVGASFQLGATGTFLLGMIVALVLMILGLNLLDVFPWARKLQPSLPAFFGASVQKTRALHSSIFPLVAGVATFFLPCGFTQSMQIYTLSVGGFMAGGLTMLFFALGTLPVLALLSFGSLGVRTKKQSSVFFKTAGLVVLFFGILNAINSMVALGVLPPILGF